MAFYPDMQKVANGVFAQFQQGEIVYIEITPGGGPADDPGAAIETRYILKGVSRGVEMKYVTQGLASATDLQVNHAVEAEDETGGSVNIRPVINGFVEIDGHRHKITNVISKPQAGEPVAFSLIVEK